ncbi:Radical SAM domain protein [Leptospira interrogans]|nr:Radical SAM domain protein [Leptospira interrogans]OCC27335.1 Radical SAM domain protein [Leptospira interrogans serovar Canicola]
MPLLPHISDTGENLEFMFQTFQEIGIRYIFPASLTLFGGNDPLDHKNLIFKAIENHFPHLLSKYQKFFPKISECPISIKTLFTTKLPSYVLNTVYKKEF